MPARNHARANARAQRQAHQIIHTTPCPQLPLRISHAVGIIIHRSGQSRGIAQNITYMDIIPPRHIGEGVHNTGFVVHKARQAHAHGFHARVFLHNGSQTLAYLLHNTIRGGVIRCLHGLCLIHNLRALHHCKLNGRSAHIYADRKLFRCHTQSLSHSAPGEKKKTKGLITFYVFISKNPQQQPHHAYPHTAYATSCCRGVLFRIVKQNNL